MSDALPASIKAFVDATNAGDTAAFLDSFAEDAYLNDWGREFHNRDGIASWDSTDNIGVDSHFEVVSVAPGKDDEYVVTMKVSGHGFNGTGPMTFTVTDGKIARLIIS